MKILNTQPPWWAGKKTTCQFCGAELEMEATDHPIANTAFDVLEERPGNQPPVNLRRQRTVFKCVRCRQDLVLMNEEERSIPGNNVRRESRHVEEDVEEKSDV